MTGIDYAQLAQEQSMELFTKKSDGYYRGCGCGMKAADKVTMIEGTVELLVMKTGPLTGPVSGIEYNFVPNTVSIDIDPRDATQWRIAGIARNPMIGLKGRFARNEPTQS